MAETVKEIKSNGTRAERKIYSPKVDVIETSNNILLIADMPGVDERSVDVTIEKSLLTIHGMIEHTAHNDLAPAYTEYDTGDYQRVFNISDEIDRDNIKATVNNGVLKVVLPKSEHKKTRKIQVTNEN